MTKKSRWRRTPIVFALLLMAGAASGDAQSRRALLVGIDDYTGGPNVSGQSSRPRWRNLAGAVNDVQAWRGLLISKCSFRSENIEVLTNRKASRDAILKAIREHLIAPARKGDDILFFYAGHGSQVVNTRSDEPDKRDETIVPADSRLGAPDIRDKELRRLFNQILDRGARLTVILDSCHSGSGTRGLPSRARVRAVPLNPRDVQDGTSSGPLPEERGALILSAAQDDQLALETTDEAGAEHGAFSLALIKAMGRSEAQTPTEHVFLRAKALLQTRWSSQEPVLAGNVRRREQPLFSAGSDQPSGGRVVAVRRIEPDGTILLQGGWADGLREGNILALRTQTGLAPHVQIRITALEGPSASEAQFLGAARPSVAAGDLFELVGWTVSSEPSLRVWIPEAGGHWKKILRLAHDLQGRAAFTGFAWVLDPVVDSPTHILSWEDGGWSLINSTGEIERLGADPGPATISRRLSLSERPVRLFVHLPARSDIAKAIRLGSGTHNNAIERTQDPGKADYFLVGRWNHAAVEYAWVHPYTGKEDQARLPLPSRTDWLPSNSNPKVPSSPVASLTLSLEDAALRIAKIRAWLTLEPPPGDDFPYHLVVKDSRGRPVTPGTPLPAGSTYGLTLAAQPRDLAQPVAPRHVYVFSINSSGSSVLLFPPSAQGNVENRFPILSDGPTLPSEIPLGRQPSFRVAEPFGIDIYFLLTSKEPIPNPWMLEFAGVRTRGPDGRTPLEALLSQRGTNSRSTPPVTPMTWSIERQIFTSTPAP